MPLIYTKDAHREYYSTYRPISLIVHDSSSDTAFIRGELFIEVPLNSGTWQSTDILINAYQSSDDDSKYEFNLMEYCRNYVSPGVCPILSTTTWQFPGAYETNRFRLEAWAVKHSQSTIGGLYDELGDVIVSSDFTGIGTITHDEDSGNIDNDFTEIERFVVGKNNDWAFTDADSCIPLTDLPQPSDWSLTYTKHTTININDYPEASLYSPVCLDDKNYTKVTAHYYVWDGSAGNAFTIPLTPESMVYRLPVHPKSIEFLYFMKHGTPLNQIVDSSGNLIATGVSVSLSIHDNNFTVFDSWKYAAIGGNPQQFYHFHYSDKPNNGLCNSPRCRRVKFVFKNMRGGFDWFNCYGTQKKEVSMSGTKFDSHVYSSMRGYHGRKQLWTKREDNFSVITQPIDTKHAEWLQQLITSPQVWVQREINMAEVNNAKGQNIFLQPILIDQGSYAIHNTEDNVNYIEFKYKYSNPITTQIG